MDELIKRLEYGAEVIVSFYTGEMEISQKDDVVIAVDWDDSSLEIDLGQSQQHIEIEKSKVKNVTEYGNEYTVEFLSGSKIIFSFC